MLCAFPVQPFRRQSFPIVVWPMRNFAALRAQHSFKTTKVSW